jgi:hypothetical protein
MLDGTVRDVVGSAAGGVVRRARGVVLDGTALDRESGADYWRL